MIIRRPLSMTSFGRGEYTAANKTWVVEIRSVNHRYCEINIKMPRRYLVLEDRLKKEVGELYSRGRIDLSVDLATGLGNETQQLVPNLALAREYHSCLTQIKEVLALTGEPDLNLLASYKDVVSFKEQDEDLEEIWKAMRIALQEAIHNALIMRHNEGANLKEDLNRRLMSFAGTIAAIEGLVPLLLENRKAALKERVNALLSGVSSLDPMRLAQECAILADKTDVTEEIVRAKSHLKQFHAYLDSDQPIGRRLDFLAQELLRELNTMGSKISEAGVALQIVELKNDLEKIREQVQNIE